MADYIIIKRGPNPDTVFPLEKEQTTIGRDRTNDIAIDDFEISRFHARIVRTNQGYSLINLNSRNGTFLNGDILQQPALLTAGDEIGVGQSVLLGFHREDN